MDRDILGRVVRDAWILWARTQPDPKPSWLVPYDELSEPDKEADRAIAAAVVAHLNERRIQLVEIKSRGGLSPAEAEEFAALQRAVFDVLEVMYPRSTEDIDGRLARLEAIEARLKAEGGSAGEGDEPEDDEDEERHLWVTGRDDIQPEDDEGRSMP